MRGMPIVSMNRLGMAGLGQTQTRCGDPGIRCSVSPRPQVPVTGFDEQALQAVLLELQQVRAERAAIETEIQSIRTGRPVRPAVVDGPGRIQLPPLEPELPGGSITLPIVGRVPVIAVGAVAAALFFRRRK